MPTLLHRLARWAEDAPDAPAQRYKKRGIWKTITAREYRDRIHALALFLESKGIGRDDIACILSPNCPQWVHLEFAIQAVGGKSAGIYPNSSAKDIQFVLKQTAAKVVAVRNAEYLKKLIADPQSRALLDQAALVLTFDDDSEIYPTAITYKEALKQGRRLAAEGGTSFSAYLERLDPDAPCFIIFTSGTTGNPKGALLSHDNLVYTAERVARHWNFTMGTDELFSFLPLCHIAEKIHSLGIGMVQRYCVSFATRFETISSELVEVQPTLLLSVPRLWEKMMDGVVAKLKSAPLVKRKMANWALAVGARVGDAKVKGGSPSLTDLAQYQAADHLILGKVRHALGLGRANLLAAGAAALPAHVVRWFRSIGLELMEDFGQTESTGVICMTERGRDSAGTVGKPVPGMEVKIAEDGELLTRGRHVFKGYYKDDAATAQTVVDGWLHTGDLAEVVEGGLIRIRGRKKEVMKTSGGKMIAPLPIEEAIKASPLISQVCLVGDGRKYLAALVTLSEDGLKELRSRAGTSDALVVTDPVILKEVRRKFDEVNRTLASYEQVKRFSVLSREFSIDDGEMTPTMKIKRRVIEDRFKDVIDAMYPAGAAD